MGREVRRVPPYWRHPIENGQYIPLSKLQMPHWKNGEASHYQMYETATAGTPISPVMDTPEKLTHWLVSNNTPAYERQTASYEAWLIVAQGCSVIPGGIIAQRLTHSVEGYGHERSIVGNREDAFSKIDKVIGNSNLKQQERE